VKIIFIRLCLPLLFQTILISLTIVVRNANVHTRLQYVLHSCATRHSRSILFCIARTFVAGCIFDHTTSVLYGRTDLDEA